MAANKTTFRKGHKKVGGRVVGSVNVQPTFRSMREELVTVYNELGGWPAFLAWGLKNPTPFYQMMTKLLPPQVIAAEVSGEIVHRVVYGQPQLLEQKVIRIEDEEEKSE